MKNPFPVLIVLSCASFSAQPQVTKPGGDAAAATWPTIAPLRGFTATERSSYQTRWARIEAKTNAAGRVFLRTNSFVELGAGLNRWAGNQWVASMPQIQAAPGGALGSNARHQVWFASDLNTQGAVALTGPDGRSIRSQILGLSYYDAATGTNVLIATTKSCQGQILPSQRQVLYTNAFAGVRADVRYTFTMAGLEQDVIVGQQLPAPEAYGLNSQTTELEILTEYLDVPTRCVPGVSEDVIEFGAMHFARGRAFPSEQPQGSMPIKLQVSRHWAQVAGRNFLIESLPAAAARAATANLTNTHASILNYKALPARQYPAPPEAVELGEPMLLAESCPTLSGFVLDWYITLSADSRDSYTFQAGSMYLISDILTVTNATFEGATVLKYGPYATMFVSNIVSTATQYEPVTFTSQEDNSISWDVSTGNTNYSAEEFLVVGPQEGMVTVSNMHFRNMPNGLFVNGGSLDLWDCQFFNCTYASGLGPGLPSQTNAQSLHLHNVLFSGCEAPVVIVGVSNVQMTAEQVTADAFAAFSASVLYPMAEVELTNCIFTGGSNPLFPGETLCAYLDGNGDWSEAPVPRTNHVVCSTSSDGIFTSAGAGNYYLVDGSTNRQSGDPAISSQMALELKQMTTVAPIMLTNMWNAGGTQMAINLPPQPIRDTNDTPDIGYHYSAVDYHVSYFVVTNATLGIGPGTVITYQHDAGGIWLGDEAEIQCTGTPVLRNVFVCYSGVQEQPVNLNDGSDACYSRIINSVRTNGVLAPGTFTFTDFLGLPGTNDMLSSGSYSGYSSLAINDCRMVNGTVSWLPQMNVAYEVENNVFEYGSIDAEQWSSGGLSLVAHNNLLHNSAVYMVTDSGWTIRDNVFDGSYFSITGAGSAASDYNAYLNEATWPTNSPPQPDDIVTNLAWVVGPLGKYYQPPNSPLIDHGSTNADALGLYHYTVLTNQTEQGTNRVDIGFHWPAISVPSISTQPVGHEVEGGDSVTFSVVVTNTLVLSYQWMFNGSPIPGATRSSFTLASCHPSDAGSYSVFISNCFGSVTSEVADLSVQCVAPPIGPGVPTGLSVTDLTDEAFVLHWERVDDADGYCFDLDSGVGFNFDVGNTNSFTVLQNFSEATWEFRVRAYYNNPRRYSRNSETIFIGRPPPTNRWFSYSPDTNIVVWADAVNGLTNGTLADFTNRAHLGSVTGIWLTNQGVTDVTIGNLMTNLQILDLSSNNLTTLRCGNQSELKSLKVAGNPHLARLVCIFNDNLTSLDFSGAPELIELTAYANPLTNISVSDCPQLTYMDVGYTYVTSLDVSRNIALRVLFAPNTLISEIHLTNNLALEHLELRAINYGDGPYVTNLDLSHNIALQAVSVQNTFLTSLDISSNTDLVALNVSGCVGLTSIDLSHSPNLMLLDVSGCMTSFDLVRSPVLTFLDCSDRALSTLDVTCSPWLQVLDCSWCGLTNLDISCNSALLNLDASHNAIDQATTIDAILRNLNNFGLSNGTVDVRGSSNAPPTDGNGNGDIEALRGRLWIVEHN
jgi:hypothetical protein